MKIETDMFIIKNNGKPLQFHIHEQIGYDIVDPNTKALLSSFYVGQKIQTKAGFSDGYWEFTVTKVEVDGIYAENDTTYLFSIKREDGSWGAIFASRNLPDVLP